MMKKVLLAEYDVSTLEFIQKLFNKDNISVTIVKDGEKAKALLLEETFDLIITAAMLPKVHGFNLSQFVSDKFPSTKVVIISGIYKGVDYRHQAITQYKADNFFEKPLNIPVFKKEIYKLLGLSPATTEIPVDTVKEEITDAAIPKKETPSTNQTQQMPKMKNSNKTSGGLTSQDIFGDIIRDIESSVPKKSAPQKAKPKPQQPPKENPGKTQVFDRTEIDKIIKQKAAEQQVKKSSTKIERDIADRFEETLSGLGLDKKKKPDTRSSLNSKINKEIEDKLENTLSGLGIKEKTIKKVIQTESEELGNYDILGLIARGGMAEIYKAKKKGAKGFEKIIAIKKILSGYGEDDKYIEMFVDEAKIAAELSHPNIVQIYDFGKKDNYYFIAMEYVHGKDLRLILRKLAEKGRTMPEPLALYLVMKVLEALDYAHQAKTSTGKQLDIVHRDISPPNILLSYNGDIKLTDFGVSKASTKMHQTVSGALKGKLLYMSPEQARGETSIDSRSDLYSVGIILFELLTGKKLFLANSELAVLKKVQEGIVSGPAKINPAISNNLDNLVLSALKRDKTDRFSNASEMIKSLEKYYRDNYENFPNHQHIAAFLYNLFKEEIKEKNLVEKPKSPPPIQPKMVVKKEPVAPPPAPKPEPEVKAETPVTEEPEVKHVDIIPGLKEEQPAEEVQAPPIEMQTKDMPVIPEDKSEKSDNFEPLFEINLDEGSADGIAEKKPVVTEEKKEEPVEQAKPETVPVVTEPVKEEKKEEAVAESASSSSFDFGEEEATESSPVKKILYVALPLIAVVFLYVYFFTGNSTAADMPAEKPKSEQQTPVNTPPAEKPAADSETGQDLTNTAPPETTKAKPEVKTELKKSDTKKSEVKPAIKKPETKKSNSRKNNRNSADRKKKDTKKSSTKKNKRTEKKPSADKETENKPVTTKAANINKPVVTPEKKDPKPSATEEKKENPAENNTEQQNRADVPPPTITEKTAKPEPAVQKPVEQKVTEGMLATSVDTFPVPVNVKELKVPRSIRRKLPSDERVIASYLVDHNGNVERIKLNKKSSSQRLNSLIYSTIVEWKFKPAMKNNVRVKLWRTKTFTIKK